MKWINQIRRFAVLAMLALILLGVFPGAASAAERTGSITVKSSVEGAVYSLYRIGTFSYGKVVLDKTYESIPGLTTNLFETDIGKAAQLISNEIARRKTIENPIPTYKPTRAIVNGQVRFSGLERGVYLLRSSDKTLNGVKYWSTSAIIEVPRNEGEKENWNVTVSPKPGYQTIDIIAYKRWSNDSLNVRPKSIRLQLMKDGVAYGSPVTLRATSTATTNWRYTWKNLSPDGVYDVVELDLDSTALKNYVSSVELVPNTNYFRVTNTYKKQTLPTTGGKLPRTGQLWWPVYVMSLAGMGCLAAGMIRRRKREKDA